MKKEPVWIEMIKDDNVNYFEAVKAFNLFFTIHDFPVMEEEEMAFNDNLKQHSITAKEAQHKKRKKTEANKSEKEKSEESKLAFEVKKFKHWEMMVRPFVKEDGSIMSIEERMKLWKQSRQ